MCCTSSFKAVPPADNTARGTHRVCVHGEIRHSRCIGVGVGVVCNIVLVYKRVCVFQCKCVCCFLLVGRVQYRDVLLSKTSARRQIMSYFLPFFLLNLLTVHYVWMRTSLHCVFHSLYILSIRPGIHRNDWSGDASIRMQLRVHTHAQTNTLLKISTHLQANTRICILAPWHTFRQTVIPTNSYLHAVKPHTFLHSCIYLTAMLTYIFRNKLTHIYKCMHAPFHINTRMYASMRIYT